VPSQTDKKSGAKSPAHPSSPSWAVAAALDLVYNHGLTQASINALHGRGLQIKGHYPKAKTQTHWWDVKK
jgi:hypothetical protein